MKKIILSALCAFLPLVGYSQSSVVKEALMKMVESNSIKTIAPVISAPTIRNATFDIARASRAIHGAVSHNYLINSLTQQAIAENRSIIPEALLAHEILNQESVMFYNATQVSSLWYFFKDSINEDRKLLAQYNKQYFYEIRPDAERLIEGMKEELRSQVKNADKRIYSQEELDARLAAISEWQLYLWSFAANNFKEKSTFFLKGYDALSWLEYYYRTLKGENCEIPGSLWKTWTTSYPHGVAEGW